jgi:hypothetical protein
MATPTMVCCGRASSTMACRSRACSSYSARCQSKLILEESPYARAAADSPTAHGLTRTSPTRTITS